MFLYGWGTWFIFALPGLLLAFWARNKVNSAFKKYSQVPTRRNLTGQQVARQLLDQNGLYDVAIEQVNGKLSDHYDPRHKVLRLSPEVYDQTSIAAAGIAAHETGHAIQDKEKYAALMARTAFVPAVNFSSRLSSIILSVGFLLLFFLRSPFAYYIVAAGVVLFALSVIFSLITLPVEFNASKRAKAQLVENFMLDKDEMVGVNKVLDAAALTYVATAVATIGQLLYYLTILNRR